jgi:hypothetical protein
MIDDGVCPTLLPLCPIIDGIINMTIYPCGKDMTLLFIGPSDMVESRLSLDDAPTALYTVLRRL